MVQIHECQMDHEIEKQLTLQREALNEIQGFDEKHRMTSVYEFVVSSTNRYEDTEKRKTGTIKKSKQEIHTEQLIRALRVVSVPVCDPFVRKTCETLKQRSKARAVFVVLISDTDIRNWMNALHDYLIPLEDTSFRTFTEKTDTPEKTSSSIPPQPPPPSSTPPISSSSAPSSLDLRDSCELIKSRIQESIREM